MTGQPSKEQAGGQPTTEELAPCLAGSGAWGERTPRTQIVAIGAAIDAQELNNKFDACIEQS